MSSSQTQSIETRRGWALPRPLDVVLSLVAIAMLVVLLPLLGVLIKLDSRGKVFFHQARLGQRGRVFQVTKFRTMVSDAKDLFNADGSRLVGQRDPRITRMGRFLRLGVDELPQVLNVLRGDMSFIGPRPDDAFAAQHYEGLEWLKLAAKPGITGLAQVTGRNALAWHDRIPYDIYYHYRRSLAMDLRIIGRTLAMLLKLDIERPLVSPAELKAFMSSAGLSEAAEQLRQEVLLHPRSGSTTVSRP